MKNKNFLIAIPTLLKGGTEYQVLSLATILLKNFDCTVTVFCYFEYCDETLKLFKDIGAKVILMTETGIRPKTLPKIFISLFNGIRNLKKIEKFDTVHIQYNSPGTLAIIFFKLLNFKNIIVTSHTVANTKKGSSKNRKIIPNLMLNFVDVFLCVSKSIENSYFNSAEIFDSKKLALGRKHFTLYNGIDLNIDHFKKNKSTDIVIGMACRIVHQKGIDILLRSLPNILTKYNNIKVIILGEGDKEEEYIKLSKSLFINDSIQWIGYVNQKELPKYFSNMDIFIMPSRFEGFGLSAIEAMSYNIPIIASNVDALKEIIIDKESGLLFENENHEELSTKILSLIDNEELRKDMGKKGRERVLRNFSLEIFEKKTISLYKQILKEEF